MAEFAIRAREARARQCTARTCRSRNGCSTTASRRDSVPTRLPAAQAHYLPLTGAQGRIGVLALLPANPRRLFVPEQIRLLETFASQIALALERAELGAAAKRSALAAESERLRNALLAGISHDLRTPLASIVGASSSLAERSAKMTPQAREELMHAIQDEAQRMAGLVDNVLDMARLQAGAASLNLEWHPLEELVGATLAQARTHTRTT